VELVGFGGGQLDVGDEGVVPPVRPQLRLDGVGEPGAAHDEADLTLGAFGETATGDVRRFAY
jgi:hypothetical protein